MIFLDQYVLFFVGKEEEHKVTAFTGHEKLIEEIKSKYGVKTERINSAQTQVKNLSEGSTVKREATYKEGKQKPKHCDLLAPLILRSQRYEDVGEYQNDEISLKPVKSFIYYIYRPR